MTNAIVKGSLAIGLVGLGLAASVLGAAADHDLLAAGDGWTAVCWVPSNPEALGDVTDDILPSGGINDLGDLRDDILPCIDINDLGDLTDDILPGGNVDQLGDVTDDILPDSDINELGDLTDAILPGGVIP